MAGHDLGDSVHSTDGSVRNGAEDLAAKLGSLTVNGGPPVGSNGIHVSSNGIVPTDSTRAGLATVLLRTSTL